MQMEIARTNDGGSSWTKHLVELQTDELFGANLEGAYLSLESLKGRLSLHIPVETSSNFKGELLFTSDDDALSWQFRTRISRLNDAKPDLSSEIRDHEWILRSEGGCEGFKVGCTQTQTLFTNGKDVTPPQIKELQFAEKEAAKREALERPMFSPPPGGNTRISLNRGFDQCNAPTASQMQAWWNNSPHYNANIYMSGRNRACSAQPNLSVSWINQVTAMGWGLIPTVVGYQSPCTASTTTAKLSYDVLLAEQQGRGEADIAVTDATNLGLTTGSILYYDMERYDPPSPDTLGCRPATVAFLKGWTNRIHELGYKSGVYGSPKNAQEDWQLMAAADKMDDIWMARWDNVMTVWTYITFPSFPTTEWANHQRIKQWQAPHNETWGGVTINIDGNILDAPVAGNLIARNINADFDGDGKTDISLFRPENGAWYILYSSDATFSATSFGVSTDIPVPGDYDGDGKTDRAVYRPTEGTWYFLTKANMFSGRVFGSDGDIPAAADYNGDGKTDPAVFRPSNSVWYIANSDSQGTTTIAQFGASGDKPVPADYDNDGKADIGIFRPNGASGGEWWIMRSNLGLFAATFGTPTAKAVQGDYTGDGKTDVAFFEPSSGIWYVLRSEDLSYFGFPFGVGTDIPSPGDFDGDGKFYASIFSPAEGTWYINRSAGGVLISQFGANGDKPVPNAYLPGP
jgi:hypothetical protein